MLVMWAESAATSSAAVADEAAADVGHVGSRRARGTWSSSLAKTAADHGRGYTCCSILRICGGGAAASG